MVSKDWKDASQYPKSDASPEQWAWEFLRRNPKYKLEYKNGTIRSLDYGEIIFAQDPETNDPPDFGYESSPSMMEYLEGGNDGSGNGCYLEIEREGQVAVLFDLNYPLAKQIELAKFHLELYQKYLIKQSKIEKSNPRNHPDKFANYLRILDATDQGTSHSEIASVIFPHLLNSHPDFKGNGQVKNSLRSAKRYRDNNYKLILLMAKTTFPRVK